VSVACNSHLQENIVTTIFALTLARKHSDHHFCNNATPFRNNKATGIQVKLIKTGVANKYKCIKDISICTASYNFILMSITDELFEIVMYFFFLFFYSLHGVFLLDIVTEPLVFVQDGKWPFTINLIHIQTSI
jgi:hypothetical protein